MKMYKVYFCRGRLGFEKDAGFKKDSELTIFLLHLWVSFKCVQNIPKTLNRDSFSKSINVFCSFDILFISSSIINLT